jgi:group I intron endonuclease
VYVGGAVNFNRRWKRHLNDLRRNIHSSIKLQRAFNKYSESNFIFEVVEEVKYENPLIVNKENYYIKKYDSKKCGYNIADASFGDVLTNHPNKKDIIRRIAKTLKDRVSKLSDRERIKKYGHPMELNGRWNGGSSRYYCSCGAEIGWSAKKCSKCYDRSGTNNHFFGKRHTKKSKRKMRLNGAGRGKVPTNARPIQIGGVKYSSAYEAFRELKISSTVIRWRVRSKNTKFKKYKYSK